MTFERLFGAEMQRIRTLRLCGLLLSSAAAALAQAPDCSRVPGWSQQGPPRSHTAENLFEYMDGNAEGYLIYRFVKMQGVNCQSGGTTIVFDVSEMADPEAAYGIFCANRDPRQAAETIGMGGQVVPRRAIFAKDKYFVELSSSSEQPDVLRAFARAMEKRIAGRSDPPDAIAWFPAEKLDAASVRLIPESVLGIRLLKRGYVAQYEFGKAFLVAEESPESAAAVMTKLRARVGDSRPAKIADDAFEAADKYLGRLCVFRKGRYLAGFAGLKDDQDAAPLATRLAARIP